MGYSTNNGWSESFYVTGYSDPQAIANPQYKPRGGRKYGPFNTHADAEIFGCQLNCTHFTIDKAFVAPNIHLPFLDQSGMRVLDHEQD
jgi:hypothetical protein